MGKKTNIDATGLSLRGAEFIQRRGNLDNSITANTQGFIPGLKKTKPRSSGVS